MAKIQQLSPQEAQKIAAGQVVERPANVLKELIENSIDAGSTRIEISIEEAGQKLLRIVDNGCGMSEEDAQLAFNRHATSKIRHIDQLPNLTTFGFRGEALASIAAVSKVTLITREEDASAGIKVVRFGDVCQSEPTSCNPGTEICIEDLFYNVPARKKFLKKEPTEWRQIQCNVQAFCLRYLSIHFKLYNEGKLVYSCPATSSYKERIAQLWDTSLAGNIIDIVTTTKNEITVEGAITNQQYYRYDRSSLFVFVNNRWVKNQELARALLKGYMNVLPAARYPAAALIITTNPLHVDVNVHPRKEEVAFVHPRRVETVVTESIQATLEKHLSEQLQRTVQLQKPSYRSTPSYAQEYRSFPRNEFPTPFSREPATPFALPKQPLTAIEKKYEFAVPSAMPEFDVPSSIFEPPFVEENTNQVDEHVVVAALSDFQVIGQLHNTYILLEQKEGLFIVDQHAAHERILYEQFKKERFGSIPTVELLFPVSIDVTLEQLATLEPYLEVLHEHGLQIDQFGSKQLVIKAAPVHAKHIAFDALIKEVIGWIHEAHDLDAQALSRSLHEKIHAQMACKAAVKAGDSLTHEHMRELIKNLSQTTNRFTCPHGRPTGWLISLYEIEKKFKRKL